jgi:hypothetical protein
MTILTMHYRYKRPPRKRKAVALVNGSGRQSHPPHQMLDERLLAPAGPPASEQLPPGCRSINCSSRASL